MEIVFLYIHTICRNESLQGSATVHKPGPRILHLNLIYRHCDATSGFDLFADFLFADYVLKCFGLPIITFCSNNHICFNLNRDKIPQLIIYKQYTINTKILVIPRSNFRPCSYTMMLNIYSHVDVSGSPENIPNISASNRNVPIRHKLIRIQLHS